jgi:hypothetical protein
MTDVPLLALLPPGSGTIRSADLGGGVDGGAQQGDNGRSRAGREYTRSELRGANKALEVTYARQFARKGRASPAGPDVLVVVEDVVRVIQGLHIH